MSSMLTPLYRSIRARLAEAIVSETVVAAETQFYRILGDDKATLHVYHCPSDPHSHLLLQGLQILLNHYHINVHVNVVPEPKLAGLAAYGGEEEEQFMWRVSDCVEVARIYPELLKLPEEILPVTQIDEDLRQASTKALVVLFQEGSCSREQLEAAIEVGAVVLRNAGLTALEGVVGLGESWKEMEDIEMQERLQKNLDSLTKNGHYLSGTVNVGPEWFWGIDRLMHLERRLLADKLHKSSAHKVIFSRTHELVYMREAEPPLPQTTSSSHEIVLYWSFGSPYSQIALRPLFAMADHYAIPVVIKPLVPRYAAYKKRSFSKTLYIIRDAKREATVTGWPDYGRTDGVVGQSQRNAFAAYILADRRGKGREYLLQFSQMAWALGKDFSQEAVVKEALAAVGNEWDAEAFEEAHGSWRAMDKRNYSELKEHGLWGVPSYTYADVKAWGQDRLFVIENAIRRDAL